MLPFSRSFRCYRLPDELNDVYVRFLEANPPARQYMCLRYDRLKGVNRYCFFCPMKAFGKSTPFAVYVVVLDSLGCQMNYH